MRRGKRGGFLWSAMLLSTVGGVSGMALADELLLPPAIDRGRTIEAVYRFAGPVTGHGLLDLDWSDTAGRLVERRSIPLDITRASDVTVTLDTRRAVTIRNRLVAHLSFDGVDERGEKVHRETEATTSFAAIPPDDPWSDYQLIIWQGETPAGYADLKKLGVTAAMLETNHRDVYTSGDLDRLMDADLGCYLENIATDFYSPYHTFPAMRR